MKRAPEQEKALSNKVKEKLLYSVADLKRCPCPEDCLRKKLSLFLEAIVANVNAKVVQPHPKQRAEALKFLQEHSNPITMSTTWSVFGVEVCKEAWAISQGLCERTLRDYERLWREGATAESVFHGNVGQKKPRPKT